MHTLNPLDISVKVYSQKGESRKGGGRRKTPGAQEINMVSSMYVARVA